MSKDSNLDIIHKKRRNKTREKVDEAIKKLILEQKLINFNSVHKESGLSKTTLYNNKDIRERIEALKAQQEGVSSPSNVKRNISENNKNAIIESLKRKIKKLEAENQELKEQIKINMADIYRNI